MGFDFRTDRFWQNLTEPLKGTTRLMYERQENSGSWARVIQPDGSQTGWVSPNDQLLDQLALIYYLRLRPETRQIVAVDYPKPAQGQLEVLPASNGLVGYRFARDDVLIEVWYRQNAQRTPCALFLGATSVAWRPRWSKTGVSVDVSQDLVRHGATDGLKLLLGAL